MRRVDKLDSHNNLTEINICDMVNKLERLAFRYNETSTNAHCFIIYEDGVATIKREGEVKSELRLIAKEKTTAKVITPYGEMDMQIYTYDIQKTVDMFRVDYAIIENEKVVSRFDINWTFQFHDLS